MDPDDDSQATQQATQNALDPRRLGKQNSGFSDEDISDIICLLYPNTEPASQAVQKLASLPEYSQFITGRYAADAIESDLYLEDDARDFSPTRGIGEHAIVLKLSAKVKDSHAGFTFGRNLGRCDICFLEDPLRRLSNIHFRIYVNEHGVVMLEDQSTNGTIVDEKLLKKKAKSPGDTRRLLDSGSTIKILMHEDASDLIFMVRIPRRDGEYEEAYKRNLEAYLQRRNGGDTDPNRTIGPGPTGHVNLFPPPVNNRGRAGESVGEVTQPYVPNERIPKEWRGGEKYARVNVIGKGAFATVYKVTSKYDGLPYAAKELDKRKFIKNGVLDQKVENEMKIMQQISHENIVQYIEHFDWEAHQFIIVMEYVPGGDLGKLIQDQGAIAETHVKVIAKQLISALAYLHEKRITHRDVKPDNILIQSVSPLVVKLTDFGLSKMIDTEQTFLKTFCGTLLYCAPEVYSEYSTYDELGRRVYRRDRRAVDRERYDHAVDIWSLGGVLFYALTGNPPFPVKNGISYTELLHLIMTTPLNVAPLELRGVSKDGINFLQRMINRRPETRATIAELQAHPWLGGPRSTAAQGQSDDEISDDEELEQGASQLSLQEQYIGDAQQNDLGEDELGEPEPDFSPEPEYDSEKENYTFGQPQPHRLFGEINTSAIGSSGAIPEDRLNLPISADSFGTTEIIEQEIVDSFEAGDLSTPRQENERSNSRRTAGNARSIAFGDGSQSLGGAESILENLNMRSLVNAGSTIQPSEVSDLGTSKRKPDNDVVDDEIEAVGAFAKPSFKRLKSRDDDKAVEDEFYPDLYASVPQAERGDPARTIDWPVHKATFWEAASLETWHLNYPEMCQSQFDAFKAGALRRGEEFAEGKTPLWELAMRCFPPSQHDLQSGVGQTTLEVRAALLRRDGRSVAGNDEWDIPATAPPPGSADDADSLPDTLPPDSQFPPQVPQVAPASGRVVGTLTSAPGSLLSGISIQITDPILSWGRALSNSYVYQPSHEAMVPKFALRLLLWNESRNSSREFRPWDADTNLSTTLRASPAPESYAFYIATKATSGLRINQNPLEASEPKNSESPCRWWMRLYHGDTIVFWGNEDVNRQARLTFECTWGSSSQTRPADEPPTCVPEAVARRLDEAWKKGEKNLERAHLHKQAMDEYQVRKLNWLKEHERSRVFEQKRAEAVRAVALRPSSQSSPSSTQQSAASNAPRFWPPPPPNPRRYIT